MSNDGLAVEDKVTEEQVARYLSENPEFFCRQDNLLAELRIPHQYSSGTVSLVERQLSVLRGRNHELRERLTDLINIARDNDRLFEKTRRLVLSILEARTLDDLADAIEDSLAHDFKIDYVGLMLVSDKPCSSRIPCYRKTLITSSLGMVDILNSDRIVCGRMREKELRFLFPNHWRHVQSTAIIPLFYRQALGVMAVGSRNAEDFRAGSGTMFLSFIGEVISRGLEALMFETGRR